MTGDNRTTVCTESNTVHVIHTVQKHHCSNSSALIINLESVRTPKRNNANSECFQRKFILLSYCHFDTNLTRTDLGVNPDLFNEKPGTCRPEPRISLVNVTGMTLWCSLVT